MAQSEFLEKSLVDIATIRVRLTSIPSNIYVSVSILAHSGSEESTSLAIPAQKIPAFVAVGLRGDSFSSQMEHRCIG